MKVPGVILGLALVGAGSLARGAPPENTTTAQARERRLHVAGAEASSYLINDWNKFQENYLPLYVGDDDPKTAWTLKTEGIGEWLRLHVTPMAGATRVRLKVRNGYQKSDKLFAANSRAKDLTVVLLPSKKEVEVTLADQSDWQEIVVEQPAGAFEAVELRVRSVYAGKKYDDLCLSDVQLFVTATTPDNPAFEKQRLQKILTWKAERLAAAKLFASALGKSLPLAARYTMNEPADQAGPDDAAASGCDNELCAIKKQIARAKPAARSERARAAWKIANDLAARGFEGLPVARVSSRDKRKLPRIDGLCTPALASCAEDPCLQSLPLPGGLGYLNAESLVLTEQQDLPSLEAVLASQPPVCKRREDATFAYVYREPAAKEGAAAVRAVVLATCGLVPEREGWTPESLATLLVYGPDGQLGLFASARTVSLPEWEKGATGPKLVRAQVVNDGTREPRVFVAAADAPAP